ncbi:MAG: hypothetical protein JWQ56_1437 [Pseudarthrobacter sp.]|nr:hypothetical protein [Pseudarthrobacter sp.]
MKKIKGYDDPLNFDITNRPSDASLRATVVFGFFLSALPGAVTLPLIYSWIVGEPTGGWAIFWALIGALVGMTYYFPSNKRSGRIKRREFISAGGDPTGITDHMFGGMGGYRRKDGSWQWSSPSHDI